jgi:hypothetical protein
MMEYGHVQMLAKWIKMYGPVIRVGLGEREAVSHSDQSSISTLTNMFIRFSSTLTRPWPRQL